MEIVRDAGKASRAEKHRSDPNHTGRIRYFGRHNSRDGAENRPNGLGGCVAVSVVCKFGSVGHAADSRMNFALASQHFERISGIRNLDPCW